MSTWCNPGAVVWVSLGSARSWMVPLPLEHIELLMCLRECSGSFRGACFGGMRAVSAKLLRHLVKTWSRLKHEFRSRSRSRSLATCLPASGCGPPQQPTLHFTHRQSWITAKAGAQGQCSEVHPGLEVLCSLRTVYSGGEPSGPKVDLGVTVAGSNRGLQPPIKDAQLRGRFDLDTLCGRDSNPRSSANSISRFRSPLRLRGVD